jgi:hypothetical protein
MKARHALLAILITASSAAKAQVAPAATGPNGLPLSGTLRYDLRYTQMAMFNQGAGGSAQMSILSGDVTYANANLAHPTTLTYSGGDMWNISGAAGESGVFQHLMVSQGIARRAWSFNMSDNVSYMPQSPYGGFSGIPGIGSLPGLPGLPSQPILTLNTRTVENTVSPVFTHIIDHATSLNVNASYDIVRYPDGNGLEIDSVMGGPLITRRLNALNSITGQYIFNHISYPGYASFTMTTQSALLGYLRTWTRRFNTSVSAGPQWIQSSLSTVVPSSTSLSVNANATYLAGRTTATLSYIQMANGGAGISTQIGVQNEDVNAVLSRPFGKDLTISAMGSFMRTTGLNQFGVTYGKYGGVTATRQLGRSFSIFANYTATQQSTSSALTSNTFSGLSHMVSFGFGYSPREMHFKR